MSANPINAEAFGPRVRKATGDIVYGVRLENTTTRNAEYTITVTESYQSHPSNPSYIVEAAWGKLGQGQQIKTYEVQPGNLSTPNKNSAISFAKALRSEKIGGAYKEVRVASVEDGASDVFEFDEVIVQNAPTNPVGAIPAYDIAACGCNDSALSLSAQWVDASPATAEIAQYLKVPGYELVRLPLSPQGAPRWLVFSQGDCAGGYTHSRAVPVGNADARRATPAYISDLVTESTAKDARNKELSFALVLEEQGADLLVIDALSWMSKDLTDSEWLTRRSVLEGSFQTIFPTTAKSRQIRLAPRVVDRLRETYLTESDKFRFELYVESGALGEGSWVLP